MKTLICYTSQTGFTKKYSEWLKESLDADLFELKEVQKMREINVWNGDSATVSRKILGSPVIIEPYGNITLLLEGI